jgi:transposase
LISQKKSREESQGTGSGVEILVNEPYSDGPGGSGQYTHKVYHVGRHLPGWLKALLPRTALVVDEEAWNSYPYTKTRYGCPFLGEKFSIEIETKYYNDDGHQVNVFDLSEEDLKARSVDVIDIVKDQLWGSDYVEEEDPKTFVSEKTGRGPLGEDWIETGFKEDKIMCAYKLCRVEFRFWGFQGRGERFIHDTALRRVMLRAHRQAWAWQDEWFSLTMDDIRKLEKETQDILAQKMSSSAENESDVADATPSGDTTTATNSSNPSKTSEQSSSKGVQKSEVQRNKSSESSEDEFVDAETA